MTHNQEKHLIVRGDRTILIEVETGAVREQDASPHGLCAISTNP